MDNSKKRDLRRLKYGTVSIVFTVIFAVFIILLNAVLSYFGGRSGGLYLDLTNESIYELSDTTLETLSLLDASDPVRDVRIIFCMAKDKISDVDELAYINRLADKYATVSKHITVEHHDLIKDPFFFNRFRGADADRIAATSVIVYCEQTEKYVVYPWSRFFKVSAETGALFAYDGENKFTAAIRQTATKDKYKAAFITGHGEDKRVPLISLLTEQGYEVSELDLFKTNEEELASYDLLVICNPKKDFTGVSESIDGRVNEIDMLNHYLTNGENRNLMVFIGSSTADMPEFAGFLSDDWGVSFVPGCVVIEDQTASVNSTGTEFIGTASKDGADTVGGKIRDTASPTGDYKVFFGNATPLVPTFAESGYKALSCIYTTSKNAVCRFGEEESVRNAFPLMTVTAYSKTVDKTDYSGHVLVSGSVDFLNEIENSGYANMEVLRGAFSLSGNKTAYTGIAFKVVEDTAVAVTSDMFKRYIVLLAVIIPCVIAAIGTAVYIKRKKS